MAEHFTIIFDPVQLATILSVLRERQADSKLDQILNIVQSLKTQGDKIMATLDEVLADAQAESTVDDSIIALLTSIKAQLDALLGGSLPPDLQAKVDAIFTQLEQNKAKVAAAVTANTPPTP